jgi:hypothetical protein
LCFPHKPLTYFVLRETSTVIGSPKEALECPIAPWCFPWLALGIDIAYGMIIAWNPKEAIEQLGTLGKP